MQVEIISNPAKPVAAAASAIREAKPPKNKRQLAKIFPPIPMPRPFSLGVSAGQLIPVPAAALLLDCPRREVIALIEEGRLRWAFDIRTANAGRGEIRVLGLSLLEFAGLCPAPVRREGEAEEFLRVAELILPSGVAMKSSAMMTLANLPAAGEKILRGTEVAQCLACNCGHVRNLIHDGTLHAVNLRRGPHDTPLILRASVVRFLKDRRAT